MTDLGTRLRDALHDEEDERLSGDEAAAMRRVVIAAARAGDVAPARTWLQPLAVAMTLVAMVGIGIAIGQRFDAEPVPVGAEDGTDGDRPAQRTPDRQLQFATPGGTRIIWIFNSHLDLKTTP